MSLRAHETRFLRPGDPAFPLLDQFRYEILYKPFSAPKPADWGDSDPGVQHLAVLSGGKPVGYGRLQFSGGSAQIRHVSVDPTWRKMGLGSEITHALIDRAKAEGAKTIWVNARFTALDFYRRLGFKDTGAVANAEGTHLPHKRMEMSLTRH